MIGFTALLENHDDESAVKLVLDNIDLLVQHFKVICLEFDYSLTLEELNKIFDKLHEKNRAGFNVFCHLLSESINNQNFLNTSFKDANLEKRYLLNTTPFEEKIIEMRDSGYLLSLKKRGLINDKYFDSTLILLRTYFRKLILNRLLQYRDKIKYFGVDAKRDDNLETESSQRVKCIHRKLFEATALGPMLVILGAAHLQEILLLDNELNRQQGVQSCGIVLFNEQILNNISACSPITHIKNFISIISQKDKTNVNHAQENKDNISIYTITTGSFDVKEHLDKWKQAAEAYYSKFLAKNRSCFFKIKAGEQPSSPKQLVTLRLDTPCNLYTNSDINEEGNTKLTTEIPALKKLALNR